MPAILAFLGSFIPSMFARFMLFFGRKYTVGAATILAFIAITITFIACSIEALTFMNNLLSIPESISNFLGWILPSNLIPIAGSLFSARICRAGYEIGVKKLDIINQSN